VDDAWVHRNKLEPFLGFYPVQVEAAKALWKAVSGVTNVKLQTPLNQFGKSSTNYVQEVVYGKFQGVVSHYHCSKKKIDCAGMDIQKLIKEVKIGK
jgi:hypothetical protein